MNPLVSVLIPTYRRAYTLKYVLEGLKRQTYRNFEVIVVFKPSGDETEDVLNKYSEELPIVTIEQKHGFVTDAYNLGLKEASGQIVAFLDDDAVPSANWLEEHTKIYGKYENVGGVSGTTKSACISEDGKIVQISEDSVHPYRRRSKHYHFSWSRPITGMSNWLIYLGTDGLVHHHPQISKNDLKEISSSLFLMGANMSVKKEAVNGLKINEDLILGFAFEQLLSYQIWRRGYKLLFNPDASVLHIVHSESTGRFFKTPKRAALRDAEFVLTFFFLKSQEREISWLAYALGVLSLIFARTMRVREYGLLTSLYRIYGLSYGFLIGFTYTIFNAFGQKFSIRASLSMLL